MEKIRALAALGALSQETRLDVFRLLVRHGPAGLPAGEIGAALEIPPTTLSFHLAQLAHAGLVTARRDGRFIIYAAAYPAIGGLLRFLVDDCCRGVDVGLTGRSAGGAHLAAATDSQPSTPEPGTPQPGTPPPGTPQEETS